MSAKKSSPFVAVRAAALLALLASTNPVFGQAGPAPTPAPANGAPAPAANGGFFRFFSGYGCGIGDRLGR